MLSLLKYHSILYVEDEPEIQLNIKEYLESYFGTVYVAADGKEGLALYQQYHPDVLLLDIELPYISGLEIAKRIRKHDLDVKILMLTAYTEKEKLLLATELRLTKYLVKPILPKLFKETLSLLAKELEMSSSSFINLSIDVVWHRKKEKLYCNELEILLSEKEQRLLKVLIKSHRKLVHYEEIAIAVWDNAYDREISFNSIKNQVSHLRKKLPKGLIITIYGEGYSLK